MSRLYIEMPGKSKAMRHLAHRYLTLLELHDRYRKSVSTAIRLPDVARALDVVRERMAHQSNIEAITRRAA